MPFDQSLSEQEPTGWDPHDPNPCRDCTRENCEWWDVCPHSKHESKEAKE